MGTRMGNRPPLLIGSSAKVEFDLEAKKAIKTYFQNPRAWAAFWAETSTYDSLRTIGVGLLGSVSDSKTRQITIDLADGDLLDFVSLRNHPDYFVVLRWVLRRSLLRLNELHRHRFCHGDVKLENYVYKFGPNERQRSGADASDSGDDDSALPEVHLIDFGMSRYCPTAVSDYRDGTPTSASPEIIMNQTHNPFESDMWSFVVMAFTATFDRYPFPNGATQTDPEFALFLSDRNRYLQRYCDLPEMDGVPEDARKFFIDNLHSDPTKRKTAAELLQDPYFATTTGNAAASEKIIGRIFREMRFV